VSYPITVLRRIDVHKAKPGTLLLTKHGWALRCHVDLGNGPRNSLLFLTGEFTGRVRGNDTATGLTFAEGYSWDVRVASPADTRIDGSVGAGGLIIGEDDAAGIWFINPDVGEPHYGPISLEGLDARSDLRFHRDCHWFARYEVWMTSPDGKDSEAPLLIVDVH